MSEREIRTLLTKYILEEITSEEKERFFNLFASPENETAFKRIFYSLLEESGEDDTLVSNSDFRRIFKRIVSEIKLNGEGYKPDNISVFRSLKKTKIVFRTGIAAALLIMFSLGFLVYRVIDKSTAKDLYSITFTEIKSPYGSVSQIKLPDGSQVQLNAGSILKYQSNFNESNRDLILKGEAYFKVARNEKLPLNVSVGSLIIRAVGTEFNIKGYDDEQVIETTLVEGRIEISHVGISDNESNSLDLNPNQKAIFNRSTNDFVLEPAMESDLQVAIPTKKVADKILIAAKVDVDQVTAWTEGKLIIRGEYLEDICIKLQRKFDVTFIFSDEESKRYRFSGTLLNETLEQVLDAIILSAPIKYSISGKSVLLSTDRNASDDFSKHLK